LVAISSHYSSTGIDSESNATLLALKLALRLEADEIYDYPKVYEFDGHAKINEID
jgi:hypothetical protein